MAFNPSTQTYEEEGTTISGKSQVVERNIGNIKSFSDKQKDKLQLEKQNAKILAEERKRYGYNPLQPSRRILDKYGLLKRQEQAESKVKDTQRLTKEYTPSVAQRIDKFFGIGKEKPKSSMEKEKMRKVLAIKKYQIAQQYRLQKIRLQMENERYKQNVNRLKLMRQQDKFKYMQSTGQIPVTRQFLVAQRPQIDYGKIHPIPEVNEEINTAFNADIGYGDSLWSNESYFGGEQYYDNDFFHEELYLTPFEHLNIKPKHGSPLLW